jgi:hypothetical protein
MQAANRPPRPRRSLQGRCVHGVTLRLACPQALNRPRRDVACRRVSAGALPSAPGGPEAAGCVRGYVGTHRPALRTRSVASSSNTVLPVVGAGCSRSGARSWETSRHKGPVSSAPMSVRVKGGRGFESRDMHTAGLGQSTCKAKTPFSRADRSVDSALPLRRPPGGHRERRPYHAHRPQLRRGRTRVGTAARACAPRQPVNRRSLLVARERPPPPRDQRSGHFVDRRRP